jgi:hypothetical protein
MKKLALIFDCGATNVREIAIDQQGVIVASKSFQNQTQEDPYYAGRRIWDLDEIWSKLCAASKEVVSKIDEYIELLPAIPDSWKDGNFSGLKARGGVIVNAVWINGKIEKVVLKSNCDQIISLKLNGKVQSVSLEKEKQKVIKIHKSSFNRLILGLLGLVIVNSCCSGVNRFNIRTSLIQST